MLLCRLMAMNQVNCGRKHFSQYYSRSIEITIEGIESDLQADKYSGGVCQCVRQESGPLWNRLYWNSILCSNCWPDFRTHKSKLFIIIINIRRMKIKNYYIVCQVCHKSLPLCVRP